MTAGGSHRFAQRAASIAASLTRRQDADHARMLPHVSPRLLHCGAIATVLFSGLSCSEAAPGGDARSGPPAAASDTARTPGRAGSTAVHPDSVIPSDSDGSVTAPGDTFFEGSEQVWLEARARGVAFRALGQEPGWLIEFGQNDTMRIVMDYGEREIELAIPTPSLDSTGSVTTYLTSTDEHTVRIDIRDEPCADAMSGERFGSSVLLMLDGNRYRGCGRRLQSR